METGSVSSTKTKAEIKTEASTVWTIEREAWKEFARNPTSPGLLSPPFDDGRWQLRLYWSNAEDPTASGKGGLTVIARGTGQDQRASTATKAWVRSGLWSATCTVSSLDLSKAISFGTGHAFDSQDPTRSKKFWPSAGALSKYCTKSDVEVMCTLENEGILAESVQRSFNKIGHLFFDKAEVADVAFTFANEAAGQRTIFASRTILENCSEYFKNLFSSGFSESAQTVEIDIANLPQFDIKSVGGDEDDMGVFDPQLEEDTGPQLEEDTKPSKRRKIDGDENEKLKDLVTEPRLRSMIEIKVDDTCFTAYRAMLAYLHSGLLPFNALPSDYLVARAQAVAAQGPLTKPFNFPSRQQWLQSRFESLADQPDWKGVKPCSPHALYRLAHRYDIQDLLIIVKSQIFRCLDVENVAYELFTPLSFDHEEIQSGIFEYLSKHWDRIKITDAWHEVVEKFAAGELAHAAPVIKKVFELLQIITSKWEIRNAKALFDQDPLVALSSPTFGDGKWQLKMSQTLSGDNKGMIGIYLVAIRSEADLCLATSSLAWSRAKKWNATIKIASPSSMAVSTRASEASSLVASLVNRQYTANRTSFGSSTFASVEQIRARITASDRLFVECSLSDSGTDEAPETPPSHTFGTLLFDNPQYADVVYTFPRDGDQPERRIFANLAVLALSCSSLQDRYKSEDNSEEPFLMVDVSAPRPSVADPVDPDDDDMGCLDHDDEVASDGEESGDQNDEDQRPQESLFRMENDDSTDAGDARSDAGIKDEVDEQVGIETREKKRRRTEVNTEGELSQNHLRRMVHVEVDLPFTAFRAFIAYLHTGTLPFTPLPSEYIIARETALSQHEGPEGEFTFPPRGEWLRSEFHKLKGQPDWNGVEPCSPHALYRVAALFKCSEAATLALSRIVRSLTIENVSYEIFSPLSLVGFAAVEDAIFPFFRKNYAAIKLTESWERVVGLVCRGKMPSARALLARILQAVEFPKK